jgi:hypothetical protein
MKTTPHLKPTRIPYLRHITQKLSTCGLSALAIALMAITTQASEVIVDNASPSGVAFTGTWTLTTNPGYWAANTTHDGNTAKGAKSVRFTPNLTKPGQYDVYLWWSSASNRATNVPVQITHQGGSQQVIVNQQTNGSKWNLLGTFLFASGTAGNVLIGNAATNGYVFADAVRFVPRGLNPFGVSMASNRVDNLASWVGPISTAGAGWVRGFKGINNITPSQGTYNWTQVDAFLSAASTNDVDICGLFGYNATWINSNPQTLPTDNLPAWGNYVSAVVAHCKHQVKYWEVGNEPPNFTSNGTPAQYASTVVTAYNAAKAEDPSSQIGLAAKSVHINWLAQAIQAGAADHFDFVTFHPYETFDMTVYGWEAQFMSIVSTTRKMLADLNPAKADVPIWFTEIGQPVGGVNGSITFTETLIAENLVKGYAMSLAQGVSVITWFEGRDGDSGPFGLISASGVQRPAFFAFSNLIQHLGQNPNYRGWILLNSTATPQRDYGFVFDGANGPVLIAWAPPGITDTISFSQSVQVVDPISGGSASATSISLSNSPRLILGVPPSLLAQADANKGQPFPWGGDFSAATTVTVTMGNPNGEAGLHHGKPDVTSTAVTVPYGPARDCDKVVNGVQKGGAQFIAVDPNFLSYTTVPIEITAVVRRNASNTAASLKITYESTTGTKDTVAQSIPSNTQWHTLTWTITDARFVGMFGYNFYLNSASPKYFLQSVSVKKVGDSVNFQATPPEAYSTQDSTNGSPAVLDSGTTLKLTGNLWKKINYSYDIKPNTILEFDFKAGPEGEIHAIGVDVDTTEGGTGSMIFQLHGTQSYQQQQFNDYVEPGWKHYVIPIGAYTTGVKPYLLFISDKDASPYTCESQFRNVRLHE